MKLTENSILYALKRIASIAFPTNTVSVSASPCPTIVVDENPITFVLLSESESDDFLRGKLKPSYTDIFSAKTDLPYFYAKQNNSCDVVADIITPTFVFLSRYEEYITDKCDRYGRFEFRHSLAKKYNLVETPIVDEYALALRKLALQKYPDLKIEKRTPNLMLTHDIDFLIRFRNFYSSAKSIFGGDLVRDKSLSQMQKSISQYFATLRNKLKDPFILSINRLIEVSKNAGITPSFYFKGLNSKDPDATYDVFSLPVKTSVEKVFAAGMIVGMHGSLYSFDDSKEFLREKENLEKLCGREMESGRQHFLRFNIKKTLPVWQECGVKNDYTLGFAEHEGFRCGTCHPYPFFDIANDLETEIIEHPLIVMDTTLYQYRHMSTAKAYQTLMTMYKKCQNVEGDFVLLWHNTTMYRRYEKWFTEVFVKFMSNLK